MSRRARVVMVASAVSLGLAAPAPAATAHRADGDLREWRGEAPMLAGATRLSRGELIYDDWLYDDFGADHDRGPNQTAWGRTALPTHGDYRYPTNEARYGTNAADLREVRVAVDANELHLMVALQTLIERDTTAAMLAIDTDGDPATGAPEWPDGVRLRTPGADRFVTVWGSGGTVRDERGEVVAQAAVGTDLAENAIEASVPVSALGPLSNAPRVWLVTGLADAAAGGFAAVGSGAASSASAGGGRSGGTAAFNVAFRPDEECSKSGGYWHDRAQASALAGGDISSFAAQLDLAAMRAGESRPFAPKPGFYNAIYRAERDFGEGIDLKRVGTASPEAGTLTGTPAAQFKSRHQPYGLYVPPGYGDGGAVTLVGHSSLVNMNQYGCANPNMLRQLGDERRAMLVTPLGRGMISWYLSDGLDDVLGALADAEGRFGADRSRTTITGYSIGGYMAFRLGLLMPDRFARASAYMPPPAYEIWPYPGPIYAQDPSWIESGITTKIVENGLNLPFEIVATSNDEEVPVSGVEHQVETFERAGNPYRFYLHATETHLQRWFVQDEWANTRDWFGDARIDANPARVRYRRYPIMDLPRLGYRFDGAYWVDGLVVRSEDAHGAAGPNESGMVDAVTFGSGKAAPATEPESFVHAGPPSPAQVTGRAARDGPAPPRENRFAATLTNLAKVTFDVGRMGLRDTRPLDIDLRGDGPTELDLRGCFPAGVLVSGDGKRIAARRTRVGIEVPVGPTPDRDLRVRVVPSRPRLRLAIQPRRIKAGRRARLRAAVTLRDCKSRPAAGVRVWLGDRSARTDARGRATLKPRFSRPGLRRVTASASGSRPGHVLIRVLPRP